MRFLFKIPRPGWPTLLLLSAILAASDSSGAAEPDAMVPPSYPGKQRPIGQPEKGSNLWKHVELKRQFTEQGTTEESSKTTLRLEATPESYLSLVRLDLPFVDKKNGNPTTPHLGDVKLKLEARSIPLHGIKLIPSMEVTFPTADLISLGNRKYQFGPGFELWLPIWASGSGPQKGWVIAEKPLVRQVFSVAGDETVKTINYTSFEPALKIIWQQKVTLSLNPKMVFDWQRDGESGAVFELEPNWNISRRWRIQLTLGSELWGRGLPTTYGKKIELAMRFNF